MYPGLRNTEAYCTYVNDSWRQYNREKGLSTVNLCQDPTHYATDTLGALEDCKNKGSFKKATLKILAKKSKTELAKATREKKTKLRKLEKARHVFKQKNSSTSAKFYAKTSKQSIRIYSRLDFSIKQIKR